MDTTDSRSLRRCYPDQVQRVYLIRPFFTFTPLTPTLSRGRGCEVAICKANCDKGLAEPLRTNTNLTQFCVCGNAPRGGLGLTQCYSRRILMTTKSLTVCHVRIS